MSQESTKAKITTFRALTADNSASPEVVGVIMDEILELKSNIDSPTLTGTPLAPTAAIGTNTTQLATTAFVQTIKPYKVCSLLLSQFGVNAPTYNLLENTLGDNFTIIYNSVGSYTLRLNTLPIFISTRTSILVNSSYSSSAFLGVVRGNDTDLLISTKSSGNNSDNMLTNATLEVKVYT